MDFPGAHVVKCASSTVVMPSALIKAMACIFYVCAVPYHVSRMKVRGPSGESQRIRFAFPQLPFFMELVNRRDLQCWLSQKHTNRTPQFLEVTRRDIHGNEWEVTTFARENRGMAQVIAADWGLNEKKEVHKKTHSYVYCKCGQQPPCGMVVKYTLLDEVVRRESKREHTLGRNPRQTVHELAGVASKPAASLLAWSQDNPDAADSDMPTRQQISRRKSLQLVRQSESSIEEVKALVEHLKKRQVTKEWEFEILAEDLTQGLLCFSSKFFVDLLEQQKDAITQHGLRLACDATHEISNSRVKLFALGWLAQYVDGDVIRNTFVPLAFALAPSESSAATVLLLEAADGFVRAKCDVTLKQAKVAHLDGGTGLVKGFQDYFGPSLLLARSLEHVKRNIKKRRCQEASQNKLVDHRPTLGGIQCLYPQ